VQEGEIYRDTVYNPEINENIIFVLKPFHIGGSDHNWSMLIGVHESYVLKEVNTITKFIVILAVIAILITAVVVFVFLGTITKPIVRITDTFKDISEGKGDLTRVIAEKGNDEIAYMSHYFNRTLRKLKNLVITIKRQTAMLSDASNELAGVMIQTTVAINQIIASLDNIKNKVLDQSSAEAQSTVVIEHISKNIDRLKEFMDQQASNVAQTSFIIEENIGNAMKEQDEDEKQILEAVSQISKVTRQVNDELTELHNDSYEALLGGRYIELVTEEINTGINEAAEGADQINTVVSRVNELSIRNRKNIDVLLEGVSMFKTV
jgi:methyl-accepting chemotaxis protein